MEREMGARGMMNGKLGVWIVVLGILVGSGVGVFGGMGGDMLVIGQAGSDGTSFYAVMDTAGYSTYAKYGYSTIHFYPSHDLLSGEWAAAIYYDGIDTELIDPANPSLGRQAMWLTRDFESPSWGTNSQFSTYINDESWHDNSNPAPGPNTGRSVIRNGVVEIEINYEVVDLGSSDTNRSPMTWRDPRTGQIRFMNSDRYCFLQTYTVKNISSGGAPLTNVAFYQMLHSHPAAEINGVVSSTYTTMNSADPLQQYNPRNPVHQVGNFRYDITQWNDIHAPSHTPTVVHSDFVGLSSEREPDWVDNGAYRGETVKPSTGTHLRIENRSLNGSTSMYYDRVAGAMGWNLGTLNANETTSITVAVMWGQDREMPNVLTLTKTDDIGTGQCVGPGDEITYTIGWTNPHSTAATDGVLIDFLPKGVSYPQAQWTMDPNGVFVPPDAAYDAATHSYRWEIGTIAANGSGSRTLTVTVNERAEPGMSMTNRAWLSTGNLGSVEATHDTAICCWDTGSVIYVDLHATGFDNGTSWANAYTDLQRALTRVRESTCATIDEIRVAHGTYTPGLWSSDTFAIPDGVSVYGGYRGGAVNPDDRRPKEFVTILSGRIDAIRRSETVATMGDNSLLDGVTVKDGNLRGVLGQNINFMINNCVIEDNQQYGIYTDTCNVTLQWCTIQNNNFDGIYHRLNGAALTVDNCIIYNNGQNGINVYLSIPTVLNTVISANGMLGASYYGINLNQPSSTATIRNNTIAYNQNEGIRTFGAYNPTIKNCILWYNNSSGEQLKGYEVTSYSCVYDPNNPQGRSTPDGNGNITCNPDFAYEEDPNNVHLSVDSPCLNLGNPSLDYTGQFDMDGEDRVMGGRVEIGADEVNPECDSVYHPLDWNSDGVVNLVEYEKFSYAWMTYDPNNPLCDPNHPNFESDPNSINFISETDKQRFNPVCDLDQDMDVDLDDLAIFTEDNSQNWLWVACWRLDLHPGQLGMMVSMSVPQSVSQVDSMKSAISFEAPPKPIRKQIIELKDTIQFLERIWLEDDSIRQEIDSSEWRQFMEKVHQNMTELKNMENIKTNIKEIEQ